MTDFYNRFAGNDKPEALTRNRLLAVIFGILFTGAAMSVGKLGSIFEIANKIINGFGSPLLAIFLLGMFSHRANSRGMVFVMMERPGPGGRWFLKFLNLKAFYYFAR